MHKNPAVGVATLHMTMQFGDFTALDDVSIAIEPGSFHALLGENGAGKSTLVKCIMGFYQPTSGELLVDDREAIVSDPKAAHALGLGMVYQHFTLVPSLTAAENLVIAREDAPSIIDWKSERVKLDAFIESMPFKVPLDEPVNRLAAGEKQKLELLKQLYLGRHFLILDEPTSVLTPDEADELLSMVRGLTESGQLTCLMITHKFREVTAFADSVSVLRRGKHVGGGKVADLTTDTMAALMMGDKSFTQLASREKTAGEGVLALRQVHAQDRSGLKSIEIDQLNISAGEIVGVAGISGNGQMELFEILTGQRALHSGSITIKGESFRGTREEARAQRVRYIPEEPLRNASAAKMSVLDNLLFRNFDNKADGFGFWLNRRKMAKRARELVSAFNVKTASIHNPISSLSGGNVQRATLARELSDDVDLLIISNPCFGLDFSAVADIRARIMTARNSGAAVLLISEDLDEILELSDRVMVMSEGRVAYETPIQDADIAVIGGHMAGHV